jgi:hypothetical protein
VREVAAVLEDGRLRVRDALMHDLRLGGRRDVGALQILPLQPPSDPSWKVLPDLVLSNATNSIVRLLSDPLPYGGPNAILRNHDAPRGASRIPHTTYFSDYLAKLLSTPYLRTVENASCTHSSEDRLLAPKDVMLGPHLAHGRSPGVSGRAFGGKVPSSSLARNSRRPYIRLLAHRSEDRSGEPQLAGAFANSLHLDIT